MAGWAGGQGCSRLCSARSFGGEEWWLAEAEVSAVEFGKRAEVDLANWPV